MAPVTAELASPAVHLLELGGLVRLELGGQLNHAEIDALVAQDGVARRDGMRVVGNPVLRERDIGLVCALVHL